MKFFIVLVALVGCTGGGESDSHLDSGHCHAMAAQILPATLPDAVVGESYSQQLVAFGEGEVFSIQGGALPEGLALSEGGFLEGTPSLAGDYAFDVGSTVDDSEAECPVHPAFGSYTLTVVAGS